MTLTLRIGTVLALLGALVACGPKNKTPDAAADVAVVEIPTEWGGVTFDEEEAALESGFDAVSDGGVECDELLRLEPVAMMGRLKEEQILCLEHRMRFARKLTERDKVSRVLLADAWAKQDLHRWEGAARRHLEEIDRSDPDLCYLFSVHLARQGFQTAFEAVRWAEIALENKATWTPEIYAERVATLLRIRAIASQQLWFYYEDEFLLTKDPSVLMMRDKWRGIAKTVAREWLEYLKITGEEWQTAYDMCVSAAGTASFCELEVRGEAADAEGAE